MKILKSFLYLIILLLYLVQKSEKVSIVKEKNIETQMIEAFKEGYEELENGDVLFAAKNSMKQNCYIHNLNGHQKQH